MKMETAANDDVPVKEIFPELTRDVIDRMKNAGNPRLREVLALVVRHVHAIVREAEITHDEWWLAIDFLTRARKMCSENRQEFILLSDILGVSMLVDAIDHVGGPGLSESTVLGLSTPGSSGSSSPATAFFCETRIAIRWRCTAALRILMAGRSPGQSWRSGRPHPTSYTTSRTRTSRRAIYAAPYAPMPPVHSDSVPSCPSAIRSRTTVPPGNCLPRWDAIPSGRPIFTS